MRESINAYTIGAGTGFVKRNRGGIYQRWKNGYNKGSPSAEVAELADA
jgi:hypothetical protein